MKKLMGIALAGLCAAAISPAQALDLDDVLQLLAAGVEERTILQVVESDEAVFYLEVEDILDLKELGASDDFIRRLMDTPELYGKQTSTVIHDYDYDLFDDDYATIFVHHYYDPFGYYWYASPRTYIYYSPFWWNRAGFYFAGHWCWDWWDPWGPCTRYWDRHWGYTHHWGPSRTAPAIRTARPLPSNRDAIARRTHRARTISRRAGVEPPPVARTISSRSARSGHTATTPRGGTKYRSTTPSRDKSVRTTTPQRETTTRRYRQTTPRKETQTTTPRKETQTTPRVKRSTRSTPSKATTPKSTPRVSKPKQSPAPRQSTPRSSPSRRTSRRTRT